MHPYTESPEVPNVCEKCGMDDLDHYWKCEKHEVVGNYPAHCHCGYPSTLHI